MILRANCLAAFLPSSAFRKCRIKGKLPFAKRKLWVFIPTEYNALTSMFKDVMPKLELMLRIPSDEIVKLILEQCEAYKYATSLLCDDGIFIHPEVFGRIVLKLGKKYN